MSKLNNRFLTLVVLTIVVMGSSVLTVAGTLIADFIATYGAKEKITVPATYPRLAQNLQNELNGALVPQFPFNFEAAGNPFADNSGVSLMVSNSRPTVQNVPNGTNPVVPKNNAMPNNIPVSMIPNNMPNNIPNQLGTVVNPQTTPTPVTDTNTLLAERNRQQRRGETVADAASLYSVNEVRPVGVVGSGDRNRVMLYSPTTKQTFSVRRGTRFRDGTIEALTNEGVQFRRDNGTVITARWLKNSDKQSDSDALIRLQNDVQNNDVQITQLPVEQTTNERPKKRRKSRN